MAATAPLRQWFADALNVCAAVAAVCKYVVSKWRREPLKWFKTAHVYPSTAALASSEPVYAISRDAFRSIPRAVAERWKLLPFAIAAGELQAASRRALDPAAEAELRRYTSLRVRIHLITPVDYAALESALNEPRT